jgi:multidrug resistance efflux pump
MTVVSALEHGQKVNKGDKLVILETKKLGEAIQQADNAAPGATLAHEILESELSSLEKSTPMIIENTKRGKSLADEQWEYYEKVGHGEAKRATELSLHFAQQSYDYSKVKH